MNLERKTLWFGSGLLALALIAAQPPRSLHAFGTTALPVPESGSLSDLVPGSSPDTDDPCLDDAPGIGSTGEPELSVLFDGPFPDLVEVAQDVAAVDLDGNGLADLAVLGAFDDSLAILLNPATASPPPNGPSHVYPVGLNPGPLNDLPRAFVVADFDGDRRPDFAVVASGTHLGIAPPEQRRSSVTVYLGRPGGRLALSQVIELPNPPGGGVAFASSIVAVDFDGDGRLDLVVGNRRANSVTPLRGDGFGRFEVLAPVALPPGDDLGPRALTVFEPETGPPLLLAATADAIRAVEMNDPDPAAWTARTLGAPVPAPLDHWTSMVVGDFRGDGRAALAVGDAGGRVLVLEDWEGDPVAPATVRLLAPPGLGRVVSLDLGDWDAIGRDHLAVADYADGWVSVLDPRTAALRDRLHLGQSPRRVRFADWRRRGVPDLLTANEIDAPPHGDVGLALNPAPPPNALGLLQPGDPAARPNPALRIGRIQGLAEGPSENHFRAVDTQRGRILHLQANASGTVARVPNVLSQINTAAFGCPHPTGFAPTQNDLVLVGAGENRVYRLLPNGNFKESFVVQYDPGPSGFWGIAYSRSRGTLFLTAPDRHAILEIDNAGRVRNLIDTAPVPFLDLAFDEPRRELLATHPRTGTIHVYSMSDIPVPPVAQSPVAVTPPSRTEDLTPHGITGIDGVASLGASAGQPLRVAVMADGHLWRIDLPASPAPPVFTPSHLFLEGGAHTISVADDGESSTTARTVFFSVPRPLPALVEFPPNKQNKGTLRPLAALGNAALLPTDFNPGPMTLDSATLYLADQAANRLLAIDRATWSILEVVELSAGPEANGLGGMAGAPLGRNPNPHRKIGLWKSPEDGEWTVAYPRGVTRSTPGHPHDPAKTLRFPREVWGDAALLGPGGALVVLDGGRERLLALAPDPEGGLAVAGLTALAPFLDPGAIPQSLAWSEDSSTILIALDGWIEPVEIPVNADPTPTPTPTPEPTPEPTPTPGPASVRPAVWSQYP